MKKKTYIFKPKGFEPIPVIVGFKETYFILMSFEELWVLLYDVENNKIKEIDLEDEGSNWIEWQPPYFNVRKELLRIYHEYCADSVKEKDDDKC